MKATASRNFRLKVIFIKGDARMSRPGHGLVDRGTQRTGKHRSSTDADRAASIKRRTDVLEGRRGWRTA